MENPDNVAIISVWVNRTLTGFKESGKPSWAASNSVKIADRYAASWHRNQHLIARQEQELLRVRDAINGKTF